MSPWSLGGRGPVEDVVSDTESGRDRVSLRSTWIRSRVPVFTPVFALHCYFGLSDA